jgi:hypothetical protein
VGVSWVALDANESSYLFEFNSLSQSRMFMLVV